MKHTTETPSNFTHVALDHLHSDTKSCWYENVHLETVSQGLCLEFPVISNSILGPFFVQQVQSKSLRLK